MDTWGRIQTVMIVLLGLALFTYVMLSLLVVKQINQAMWSLDGRIDALEQRAATNVGHEKILTLEQDSQSRVIQEENK